VLHACVCTSVCTCDVQGSACVCACPCRKADAGSMDKRNRGVGCSGWGIKGRVHLLGCTGWRKFGSQLAAFAQLCVAAQLAAPICDATMGVAAGYGSNQPSLMKIQGPTTRTIMVLSPLNPLSLSLCAHTAIELFPLPRRARRRLLSFLHTVRCHRCAPPSAHVPLPLCPSICTCASTAVHLHLRTCRHRCAPPAQCALQPLCPSICTCASTAVPLHLRTCCHRCAPPAQCALQLLCPSICTCASTAVPLHLHMCAAAAVPLHLRTCCHRRAPPAQCALQPLCPSICTCASNAVHLQHNVRCNRCAPPSAHELPPLCLFSSCALCAATASPLHLHTCCHHQSSAFAHALLCRPFFALSLCFATVTENLSDDSGNLFRLSSR